MESNPRLLIVGDGPERAALESLAKEVYPSAEFIGAKHGAELKPYFEQADLFVLPGTGGLAVQEAMSYGLPVIVAKGDGTQDDLVREGNGWQIQPEDYGALVSAMKNALSDRARLREMGRGIVSHCLGRDQHPKDGRDLYHRVEFSLVEGRVKQSIASPESPSTKRFAKRRKRPIRELAPRLGLFPLPKRPGKGQHIAAEAVQQVGRSAAHKKQGNVQPGIERQNRVEPAEAINQ